MLFFPADELNSGKFIKYQGKRTKEELEAFSFSDYKYGEFSSDEIPKQLEGLEYYQKLFSRNLKEFTQEVDHMFFTFGLDQYLPAYVGYLMVCSMVFIPCVSLAIMLFCCESDYPEI